MRKKPTELEVREMSTAGQIRYTTDFGPVYIWDRQLPDVLKALGIEDMDDDGILAVRKEMGRFAKHEWEEGGSGPFWWTAGYAKQQAA